MEKTQLPFPWCKDALRVIKVISPVNYAVLTTHPIFNRSQPILNKTYLRSNAEMKSTYLMDQDRSPKITCVDASLEKDAKGGAWK